MTSLPEQLTAASTRQISAQLDAQFRIFNTFATQALENTSRLVSLHLSASRDSVERSSQTLLQLAQATQPRDLLVLRSHTEEQVRGLFNYGRELFNIAANAQPYGLRTITSEFQAALKPQAGKFAEPVAQAVEAVQEATTAAAKAADDTVHAATDAVGKAVEEAVAAAPVPVPAPAPEAQKAPEPPAAEEAPATEPATSEEVAATPQDDAPGAAAEAQARVDDEPEPLGKQKPIARAAGKGAPKAAAASQPLAAPVQDKDSATITRIGTSSKRRK